MLLEKVESLIPPWFLEPARVQYSQLMAAFAATLDALGEAVYSARRSGMPGQVEIPGIPGLGFDDVTALPLLGRDRRIIKGLSESWASFAGAIRGSRASWQRSATTYELLGQLARVLGPTAPRLFTVCPGGTWWVLDTAGIYYQYNTTGTGFSYNPSTGDVEPLSEVAHPWDWDSASVPPQPDQNAPGRVWIGVDVPYNVPYGAGDDGAFDSPGLVDDYWNNLMTSGAGESPTAGTIGLTSPWMQVELIRNVAAEWRSSGLVLQKVIVVLDTTSFRPTTDSTPTSIPNGKWAWHSTYDIGTNSRITARFPSAEYIPGMPGGVH
jgi:hypothetical protein